MESKPDIDFSKLWRILKQRWLPAVATFGSVAALTFVYTSSQAPSYKAQGKLLFKQDTTPSMIGLSSEQVNFQNDRAQGTQAEVIPSTPILQKALDLINQNNTQRVPLNLGDLEQGLEIKIIKDTDIIQVGYKSKDPKVAALVVNQLMTAYIDNNLWANRAAAISAGNFITAQLPMVKANVNRADEALTSFKEKNKITDLGQTQGSVAANIERTGTQIDSISVQIADLDSRSTDIQNKLGINSQQAMAVSSLSQSPAVQGVITNLQDVQRKLANARALYQELNPVVVDLKQQEAKLNTLLRDQVAQVLQGQNPGANGKLQVGATQQDLMTDLIKSEVARIGLVSQLATLSKQQALYKQKAAILPRLEQQQRQQQRELSAAESTYAALLKSLEDIKVKENQTVSNVQIIQAAQVPGSPIPKTSAIMAGILAAILLAAAVVYILEVRDKRIKTVMEARELFEYNLLGTIPAFSKTTRTVDSEHQTSEQSRLPLPMIQSPLSPISESYRMLQANLKFLNSEDKTLKVIVVTSAVPKEGKSTTCANLAVAMADLGHRTLIIDADMRSPSQHQFWQISNTVGLSNIITRQDNPNGTIIQRVMQNLYVLPAGSLPPNPVALLDSTRMAALMEKCVDHYDYVLIDTPPLAIAADAPILGKMADGVLLVTRPGIADFTNSRLAKEYLEQSGQNILGIVVNAAIPENEHSKIY